MLLMKTSSSHVGGFRYHGLSDTMLIGVTYAQVKSKFSPYERTAAECFQTVKQCNLYYTYGTLKPYSVQLNVEQLSLHNTDIETKYHAISKRSTGRSLCSII